jgi:hypothetical protein
MTIKSEVSQAVKYKTNPFIEDEIFQLNTGKKTIIVGSNRKVLVDSESGEIEAVTMLHKFKEVDKEIFVKLFIGEVQSLFDLSKSGLKVFGYILQTLRINEGTIYLNIPDMMTYCNYKSKMQCYRGLTELLANKIIAMSSQPNLWFINPKIVFNGDRIAFVKEYRLKQTHKVKQLNAFDGKEIQDNSESK